MLRSPLLLALAKSILAGEPELESAIMRASRTLGRNWRWLRPLMRRYFAAFGAESRPKRSAVVRFLARDAGLRHALQMHGNQVRIASWLVEPNAMNPAPAAQSWKIPPLTTERDLADWLELSIGELEWFADRKRIGSRIGAGPLCHYHYRVVPKKNRPSIRLVEAPQRRLKEIQRKILAEILGGIPTHPAAHGFVKGCSIRTFAAPHTSRRVVLRMDLKDFFPSITQPRVQALFRTAGYPESVASSLSGICTNAVPRSYWTPLKNCLDAAALREARDLYSRPHLPQGAPFTPLTQKVIFSSSEP